MYRRIVLGVLLGLVLIAGAAAIGFYAYQAGIAQGLVQSGKLVAPAPPDGFAYHYWGGPFFFHGPFGFGGFGFLGCLIPFLFFALIFSLIRLIIFGPRRWGWGYRGHWGSGSWEKGVPPMFEEWHQRAHGDPAGSAGETKTGPQ